MNAGSAMLWVAVIGAMAGGLFHLKHEVQQVEDELARVDRDLLASQEAIQVLRAEWSYLNRPERLSALAGRHLDLEPLAPAQIGAIEALPLRVRDGDTPPAASAGAKLVDARGDR